MQSTTSNTPNFISGPLSVGDLLDRTFRVYRLRFRSFSTVAAIFLVPLGIVSALVSGQALVNYMQLMTQLMDPVGMSDAQAFDSVTTMFGTAGIMFLIGLITFVATSLVTLAATSQAIAALHGDAPTIRQTIRRAFSRLFALLGLYLAYVAVAMAVMFAVSMVLLLLIFMFGLLIAGVGELFLDPSFGGSGPQSVAAIVGIVLLVACLYGVLILLFGAPILYLYSRWLVAVPAMLAENIGPFAAMSRSWQLSKGSVWRAIFYVILLFIVSTIVIGIPVTILQSMGSIVGLMNEALGALLYAAAIGITFIFNVVWQPFAAVAGVLLYYDLRVRSESYDLQLRVDRLESQIAGASPQA